jgi:hypothetical protein
MGDDGMTSLLRIHGHLLCATGIHGGDDDTMTH